MSIQISNLGLISYDEALKVMMSLHESRCALEAPNTLLLLQHDAVITRGRRLHGKSIPGQDQIEAKGIQVRDADRGGLLTYHGPGQIVVYFVVRFEDYFDGISDMVKTIEQGLLNFLDKHHIKGHIDPENPGVWVGNLKVASIGLRVSNGVTRHGIALNIASDLDVYGLFEPCGMSGQTMTTMAQELGRKIEPDQVWTLGQELVECLKMAISR